MLIEQLLRIIAGLLVGVWVARYLGPETFGIYSYAIAFVAIFGGIAKFGLDGIVVRDLVRNPGRSDDYLGTAYWLKLIGALLTFALIFATLSLTSSNHATEKYILVIAAGLFFQSFEVIDFYFQSQVLAKVVAICKVTQLTLSSIVKIYLVITKAGIFPFVLVSLLDQISLAVSLYIAYRLRNQGSFYWHFKLDYARTAIAAALPILLSSLFIGIYRRIDVIFLQAFTSSQETGIYSAAQRLSEAWLFVPVIAVLSVYPALVASFNNPQSFRVRIELLYMLLSALAISVGVAAHFFSGALVGFLYGATFQKSAQLLEIMVWSGAFVVIEVVTGAVFRINGNTKYILISTVWGAATAIPVFFITITLWGATGASFAVVAVSAISSTLYLGFYKETRPIFYIAVRSIFFLPLFRKLT